MVIWITMIDNLIYINENYRK